jgi:hypothetical protein
VRVGQTSRFQKDAVECAAVIVEITQQRFEGVDEVAAHRANKGSRTAATPYVANDFDEQMIERDITELVDDDSSVGEGGVFQKPIESVVFPAPRNRSALLVG